MARSWCGFAPQNETVMAQWRLLEAGQHQVESLVRRVAEGEDDAKGSPDEEDLWSDRKDHR
jgi:uncharacterized coiled-coil protein SlyX